MRIDFKGKTFEQMILEFKSIDLDSLKLIEIEVFEEFILEYGYKSWIDFAQIFYLKMLTPLKEKNTIILPFKLLNKNSSFHQDKGDSKEKYGVKSDFFKIDKTSLVSFTYFYQSALEFIDIKSKKEILNLGINKADEFKIIKNLIPEYFTKQNFTGIDYSDSAIEFAKKEFCYDNVRFLCKDINKLEELNLEKFDLIVSIGTLQSKNINFKVILSYLVQNLLRETGSIILGFPNSRWLDGENIYGAVAPNYNFSEMSLVIKDIYYAKKYLQQKKFRVTITGKDYLFLTARKIGQNISMKEDRL